MHDLGQKLKHKCGWLIILVKQPTNELSEQRVGIALKILQNMKLTNYLYEEIGSSKAENVKSKMWNEDFAEKFI